jgi:hypothetical protein
MGLPQLSAGLDVEKRQAEKNNREQQHQGILHRSSRTFSEAGLPAQDSSWLTPSLSIKNIS